MPRADLTGEYRSDHGQSSFPKLRLQAGEKARVVVIAEPGSNGVPQLFYEYVHRLEAPNIVNGAPTYIKIKSQDGSEAFKVEKRYVSNPLCFGDPAVLRERSLDVHACEACKMAEEEPEIFWRPRPRYAANTIKYNLNPLGGGWNNLVNPYGVQIVVWVFSAKVMDKLIDIGAMGDAYRDPRMVDLLLECDKDGYNFQKPYSNGEFLPVAPALWLSNDQTRQYTGAVLANNSATDEDLSASIGKPVKPEWVTDDIRKILARWQIVRQYESHGSTSIGVQGFGAETLQQGLSQLQQQFGQGQPAWQPPLETQAAGQTANPLAASMFPAAPAVPGAAPPSGLAGLEEFMRATTSNPSPASDPPAAQATAPGPGMVVPPTPPAPSMPMPVAPGAHHDPLGALSGLSPASQVGVQQFQYQQDQQVAAQTPSVPAPPTAPGVTMMPTGAPDAASLFPTAPLPAPPASPDNGDARQYKFSDLVPPQDQG
jgi:hypothetical protein